MTAHARQILVVALAGWLNRQQQDVVEYLQEENRVLREHLTGNQRMKVLIVDDSSDTPTLRKLPEYGGATILKRPSGNIQ